MEELQVEVILDILKESCHGMLEELLSPEFQKMKELVPEKWSDAVDILTQIRRNYLKRCLSEDHTLLIKGYLTASEDSPVIGALVAFRMTEAEMWKKEDETQKLADSIVQTLEKKPVGVGDVLGAKPEEYSTKLLAWSTDGPRVIAMAVAENLALMRATRGFKTFWLIDQLGVLQEGLGQGVGPRMIEKLKNQARTEKIPIFVTVRPGHLDYYGEHGFTENHDPIESGSRLGTFMKWIPEPNGAEPNGAEPNGAEPNGAETNGHELNALMKWISEPIGDEPIGDKPNGAEPNGDGLNGDELNGDELMGEA